MGSVATKPIPKFNQISPSSNSSLSFPESKSQSMENVDYNQLILARREEEHAHLVGNEDHSATSNLHHGWFIYYYAAMTLLLFRNFPLPLYTVRSDYDPTTLSTRVAQQHDTTPGFTLQGNQRYGGNWGAWLAVVTVYIGMCAYLLAYNQFKQTDPFQTHLGFIIMSIASLFMALITSGIVVYTNNNLQSLMKEHNYYSPVFDVILKSLFCFSAMLTPLSILLVLFIPPVYNWIGYMIVCALFVIVIAFNFKTLKRSLSTTHASNLGAFEMV